MASVSENKEFTSEVFSSWPLDDAIDWISNKMEPEDVFSEDHLSQWAENNGYEKIEED